MFVSTINPEIDPTRRHQIAPKQAFKRKVPISNWTKILIGVGIFFGIAFVTAAIIIPVILVPILTRTTTTTTASTTDVTMFIPSNYWTSCSASCTNVTTTTPSTLLASWKFENNLLDSANSYNGSMSSVPSYISGYVDQALIVNSVQYVTVSSYLSFFSRSFTIEAWIYVT
ncbi:unnamed protein product, partial [Rotaria sordida]